MKKIVTVALVIILAVVAVVDVFLANTFYQKSIKVGLTTVPFKLPNGFSISVFAQGLVNPRVMIKDPAGNMLVSLTSQKKVVALVDGNRDGIAEKFAIVADGLERPYGLAFRCKEKCELYIAETNKVTIFDYDQETLKATNPRKIIDLPGHGENFSRTIIFLPGQDKLLIQVGSSCNVCDERDKNWKRAAILVANLDGSDLKVYASGLRNSPSIDIHPGTGDIWAGEPGRGGLEKLGLPPDEINIIKEGKFYGFPYCYGKNVQDTDFDPSPEAKAKCETAEPAYIELPSISTPVGAAFIPPENKWPKDYWYNLVIANHPPTLKVERLKTDEKGNYLGKEDFVTGFLSEAKETVGLPTNLLIPRGEGVLYVSDIKTGIIYRVTPPR